MNKLPILLFACLLLPLASPARAMENMFEAPETRLAVNKPSPRYGYIGTEKELRENRFLVRLKKLKLTEVQLKNASMENVLVYIYNEARQQDVAIAFDGYRLQENPERTVSCSIKETTGWDLLHSACAQAHCFFYPGYASQTQNHIVVSDEPEYEPWEWVVPANQREKFYTEYSQTHQSLKDYLEAHGFHISWSDAESPGAAFAWKEWVGDYNPSSGEFATRLMPCTQELLVDFFKRKGFNIDHQRSKAWKAGLNPIASRDQASSPMVQVLTQVMTDRNARWWVNSSFFGFIRTGDRASIMNALRNRGVSFPDGKTQRVSFDEGEETLRVRGTPEVLNSVHQLVTKYNEKEGEYYRLPEGFFIPYLTELSPRGRKTVKELCELELPSAAMDKVSLEKALEYLQQAAQDAGLGQLTFAYRNLHGIPPQVSLNPSAMKAIDLLELLCKQALLCVEIDGQNITLQHDFSKRTGHMSSGTWEVSPTFFGTGKVRGRGMRSGSFNEAVSSENAVKFLESQNIHLPEGSSLTYNNEKGILRVISTDSTLRMIDKRITT